MSFEYDSLRPYKNGKLLEPTGPSTAYLWDGVERKVLDDEDREFLDQLKTGEGPYTKAQIVTKHEATHPMLFKPDLGEVLDGLNDNYVTFMNSERFYVTTTSCNSKGEYTDEIRRCYSYEGDFHHGLTTVYYRPTSQTDLPNEEK